MDDRKEKDRTNNHIILISKNIRSFKEINSILSEANQSGFYYQPRIDLELLLKLTPEHTIITTACINSRIDGENSIEKFILPLHSHFKDNFYLEVQAHPHPSQAEHNKNILKLYEELNIPIIHANDSHYIYSEQDIDRDLFLQGKGIYYDEEEGFILDYPDYETILERYKKQGVLSPELAEEAIANTLIFDECEDLGFTKEIKMPTIYPKLTTEQKHKKLKEIINKKWKQERHNIPKEKHKLYFDEIRKEVNIIEETSEVKTVDYFLLNERIINRAVNKYGGVLTRTGRGSAVSFYINKLLGFTEIDRIEAPVPLYPTRFMSKSRILETKSLPDVDFNTADQEPFIKASKDLLGEDNIYWMISYGTMQESEAFRNLCRAKNLQMEEYNEIAKNLDEYKDDPRWKDLIEQSKKYIGVIDSASPSPCSFLLLNKPISEEVGVLKIKDKFCCCIDRDTADQWKFLKNDYLKVVVWEIIANVFELINKPIPNIKQLVNNLDNRVWNLYKQGLTATLNQADSSFATPLVKKYSPQSTGEMAMFVAAIRPGFASLLDTFLERKSYTTGVKELDELLSDSANFMLFQEGIMKFLMWCGINEDETYGIIKKISKKKFKEKELDELKNKLKINFKEKTGSLDKFDNVWNVIEDAANYSFNASHAYSVALDSLYGAYLKANYPLEYFTVVLNTYQDNTNKTEKIIGELPHFNIKIKNIKFRKSSAKNTPDKETNSIYKGIASLKFCGIKMAEELYALGENEYKSFLDLLIDIKNSSIDSRQLNILTSLNFFSEFGNNQKLLDYVGLFNQYYGKKTIKKEKLSEEQYDILKNYTKETEKTLKDFQSYEYLQFMWDQLPDTSMPVKEQVQTEIEYLGYPTSTFDVDEDYVIVYNLETKYSPKFQCYKLSSGKELTLKTPKKEFNKNKFSNYDIVKIGLIEQRQKSRKTETGYEKIKGEYEKWLVRYYVA